jgi:hypothetical protein
MSQLAPRCPLCGRLVRRSRARRPRLRWVNHAVGCPARGELPWSPERAELALAWDLRAAWAGGWNVGLTLRGGRRVRCRVERVAASGAFAVVWDGRGELHVPIARVLAVARPHFHEPAWGPAVAPRSGGERRAIALPMPGQLAFDVDDGRPADWVDPREALQARRGEGKRRAVAFEKLSRQTLAPS